MGFAPSRVTSNGSLELQSRAVRRIDYAARVIVRLRNYQRVLACNLPPGARGSWTYLVGVEL